MFNRVSFSVIKNEVSPLMIEEWESARFAKKGRLNDYRKACFPITLCVLVFSSLSVASFIRYYIDFSTIALAITSLFWLFALGYDWFPIELCRRDCAKLLLLIPGAKRMNREELCERAERVLVDLAHIVLLERAMNDVSPGHASEVYLKRSNRRFLKAHNLSCAIFYLTNKHYMYFEDLAKKERIESRPDIAGKIAG